MTRNQVISGEYNECVTIDKKWLLPKTVKSVVRGLTDNPTNIFAANRRAVSVVAKYK